MIAGWLAGGRAGMHACVRACVRACMILKEQLLRSMLDSDRKTCMHAPARMSAVMCTMAELKLVVD